MRESLFKRLGPEQPRSLLAEFHTAELVFVGQIAAPEGRLSDFLNIPSPTLDIVPQSIGLRRTGDQLDLGVAHAVLEKELLLLVVPQQEPRRDADPFSWRETKGTRCWLSLGPYTIEATIHLPPAVEPKIALARIDRRFISLTDATVASQDGTREYATVLVNRKQVDLLALLD